jgi:tetratricopeptide (TPR) repeat protein
MALNILPSQDFSLRSRAFGIFPLGGKSWDRYNTGGGGDLVFDIDLSGLLPNSFGLGYSAGVEGGYVMTPINDGDNSLSLLSGGGNFGFFFYPASRLLLRADGAFGVFRGGDGEMNAPTSYYWRAGADLGFRFTPAFTISLNGGYRSYDDAKSSDPLYSGIYAGLSAHINFERQSSSGSIGASVIQDEPVIPVFRSLYRENPAAMVLIRNEESAEIRDVRVSFRADRYTASEFSCGSAAQIGRRQTVEFPLYADFSRDILNFTENGRILGELVIRYTLLGREKETVRGAAVELYNRNTFPPGEKRGLASFVSPNSPEVLEFSKNITGLARAARRTGLNQNMQFGIWLFEGLKAGNIALEEKSGGAVRLEEIQFPAQTLAYRSGSAVDLGLLYAGTLEAAGIPAALIPLEDDFIVAAYLGIAPSAASLLFTNFDRLLIVDDDLWLPLSMAGENYTSAWIRGAEKLNAAFASEVEVDFIILEDAWAYYPPAGLPPQGVRIARPGEDELKEAVNLAIDRYAEAELLPKAAEIEQQLAGTPSPILYNQLGIVLLRSGRNREAKIAYETAANMGSVPAMNNRANLAIIEKDYAEAVRWFREVLARHPDNQAAIKGLQKVEERQP